RNICWSRRLTARRPAAAASPTPSSATSAPTSFTANSGASWGDNGPPPHPLPRRAGEGQRMHGSVPDRSVRSFLSKAPLSRSGGRRGRERWWLLRHRNDLVVPHRALVIAQ